MEITAHKEQADSEPPKTKTSRKKVDYGLVNAVVNSRIRQLRDLDEQLTDTTLSRKVQTAIWEHRKEVLGDIIDYNMGLVVSIAKNYADKAELDDLKGVGIVAMLKAISSFEIGRVKFSTYVFPRIREAINRYSIEQRSLIRETVYHHKKIRKTGQSSVTQTYTVFSLSKGLSQTDTASDPLEDILSADLTKDAEQEALRPLSLIDLMHLAQEAGLNQQQQQVLWFRTTLSSGKSNSPVSQEDVGRRLNPPVKRQRVLQIEHEIRGKLCTPQFLPRFRQILSQGTEIDKYLA